MGSPAKKIDGRSKEARAARAKAPAKRAAAKTAKATAKRAKAGAGRGVATQNGTKGAVDVADMGGIKHGIAGRRGEFE